MKTITPSVKPGVVCTLCRNHRQEACLAYVDHPTNPRTEGIMRPDFGHADAFHPNFHSLAIVSVALFAQLYAAIIVQHPGMRHRLIYSLEERPVGLVFLVGELTLACNEALCQVTNRVINPSSAIGIIPMVISYWSSYLPLIESSPAVRDRTNLQRPHGASVGPAWAGPRQ